MYPNHNNQPGSQPPGQYPKHPQGSHLLPPQQNSLLHPPMVGGGQPGFNGQSGFAGGGSQGNRGVYTSMIVPQSSPSLVPPSKGLGGFGKLESMGRVIK